MDNKSVSETGEDKNQAMESTTNDTHRSVCLESTEITDENNLNPIQGSPEVAERPIPESTETTESLTEKFAKDTDTLTAVTFEEVTESLITKPAFNETLILESTQTMDSPALEKAKVSQTTIMKNSKPSSVVPKGISMPPAPLVNTIEVTEPEETKESVTVSSESDKSDLTPPLASPLAASCATACAGSEEDNRGLMLIVGSEISTKKVMAILGLINETGIKMATTPELKAEDAVRWKDADVTYVLYIIDYSNPLGLQEVDDQLTYLHTHYLLPFDRIAFLLAHEPKDRNKDVKTISASSIASFMSKYRQPVINIIFNDGWEEDESLQKQMRMFLNRFQELDNIDNANIANYSCPSSPQIA